MFEQPRAIIFANGQVSNHEGLRKHIRLGDLIVAADGGAIHCQELNLTPDYLIGDFDSLSQTDLENLERAGTNIIRHPARKDYTDLELALQFVKSIGVSQIFIFGGLGARWDQTLANLLLPGVRDFQDIKIHLIDGDQELFTLYGSETYDFDGNPGDIVSLIPLTNDASGVSTQGLEYPLTDETLFFGATRGISNVLIENSASVSIKQGILLCAIIHQSA